jgi:hypothetical protein
MSMITPPSFPGGPARRRHATTTAGFGTATLALLRGELDEDDEELFGADEDDLSELDDVDELEVDEDDVELDDDDDAEFGAEGDV